MRLVKVKAPEGKGADVAHLALGVGISQASVYQEQAYGQNQRVEVKDTVDIDTSTPLAKAFIDTLMSAPFFDPREYSISVREPRAVVSKEPASRVTRPIVIPTVDVLEELWQFTHITYSFIGRVLIAGLLLAYGMIEDKLLLMIAGLLFLPLLPLLLAVAFGALTREWRLAAQGALALAVAVVLLVGAGAVIALVSQPPLRFQGFSSPLTSFLISVGVGIAAGLATADDAGRRELIGLAATAQIALLPAWLGIWLVFGTATMDQDPASQRILTFVVNVGTIIAVALGTYAILGMRGNVVQRYTEGAAKPAA